jgi:cysteine-rich repeat protein
VDQGELFDNGQPWAGTEYAALCGATCGDSVVQAGEDCDDGNDSNDDACPTTCQSHRCGDGVTRGDLEPDDEHYENCDDANSNAFDGCDNRCRRCGDGVLSLAEGCDDGNQIEDDGCTECSLDSCGNGQVDEGEECDDANDNRNDACNNCRSARCGDGIVRIDLQPDEPNYEECDHNLADYPSCSDQCRITLTCETGLDELRVGARNFMICGEGVNLAMARQRCVSSGGRLASIRSPEENAQLTEWAIRSPVSGTFNDARPRRWIGLSCCRDGEEPWYWEDEQQLGYRNWITNQSQGERRSRGVMTLLATHVGHSGRWYAPPNSGYLHGFICEY